MARKSRVVNARYSLGKREFVVFKAGDWDRFCDMIADGTASVPGSVPEGAESGGGCGGWCESECQHNGGCRRSWSVGGACGGLCRDGSVVL